MIIKIQRPCRNVGCRNLTTTSYCETCKRPKEDRPSAHRRGYNYKWQKASKVFLSHNPLCRHCEKEDKIVLATVVDHVIPHKGDMKLFWDIENWQSLCSSCHNRKTAKEDMGRWY